MHEFTKLKITTKFTVETHDCSEILTKFQFFSFRGWLVILNYQIKCPVIANLKRSVVEQ